LSDLLQESSFVIGTLSGLGLAGGFVVFPFRKALRFPVLTAPFAGLLTVVLGTASLYGFTKSSFAICAALSAAICLAATVAGLILMRPKWRWRDWAWPLLATLAIVPVVTYATDATTIHLGRPSILYIDGTDHLGYAQMADWLCAHPVTTAPQSSAELPYEAFPAVLFRQDPRFGSFFSLALIRLLHRHSGTFSYDIACAVILIAGILGVAGAFSRSVWSCLLLMAGLLTCHWYDYGCGGYFGKLLAYPACLFVAGLFLSSDDLRSPVILCALVLLTAATALMHSGMVTAFFLGTLLFGYIACRLAFDRGTRWAGKLEGVSAPAAAAVMLMITAIVASGAPAKPIQTNYPDWNLKWDYVLPRILDLENQGVSLTFLSREILLAMAAGAFAVWLTLIAIAVRRRDSVAGGMLIGPFAVFLVLLASGGRAAAFQMIGTFYPFLMCGVVLLMDRDSFSAPRPSPMRRRFALAGVSLLALVALGLRAPRYVGAWKRYTGTYTPATLQFSEPDADRLATRIGTQTVEVDLIEPQRAIFLLVELGRREGMHFQWTQRSWDKTVGYMRWPVPSYPSQAPLKLVEMGEDNGLPVVFKSRQYQLLDCSKVALGHEIINANSTVP
jgi:hypothetical protein